MRHAFAALLAAVLMASPAMAQIEKGDMEVQASGSMFVVSGLTSIDLRCVLGFSVTDQIQLGFGPSLTVSDYEVGSDTVFGSTFFGRYYFNAVNKWVPYVSGQLYQYDIAPEEPLEFFDCTYIQGGGGFKYFVNEYIAWDLSANLGLSLGSGDVNFFILAGLSAIL